MAFIIRDFIKFWLSAVNNAKMSVQSYVIATHRLSVDWWQSVQ